MQRLSKLQRDLLSLIAMNPGKDSSTIHHKLNTQDGQPVATAPFYSSLDDLVNKELIRRETQDGETDKYSLTSAGQASLYNHQYSTANTPTSPQDDVDEFFV